jgi:tetratricopeptide (TPR) repeat protein
LQPLEERDRFTLAMAYISLERPAWARPELEKLAEVSPRNPLYPYWQGRLEYDGQNVPAAVAKFEKVIAVDPEFMKACMTTSAYASKPWEKTTRQSSSIGTPSG